MNFFYFIKNKISIYLNGILHTKIIDYKKARIDPLFTAIIIISFLWIIPVNFEKIFGRFFDVRNIAYIFAFIAIVPFFHTFWNKINRPSRTLLILFFAYFIVEGSISYYNSGYMRNMYYAAWMILTLAIIFYFAATPERMKILFCVIVFAIAFSVFFGICISFIGEPFISLRYRIIGVDPNLATANLNDNYGFMKEKDLGRVVGLCKSLFVFSYQLAALPVASMSLYIFSRKRRNKIFWGGVFIISILGIMYNAERSALLAACVGIMFFAWNMPELRKKCLLFMMLGFFLFIIVDELKSFAKHKGISMEERITDTEVNENLARGFQQVAGLQALMICPLGDCYRDYVQIARQYSSVREHYGYHVTPPHNHYIGVGFRAGWGGILFMFFILFNIWKCIKRFYRNAQSLSPDFLYIYNGIVGAFLASMINACFHNTGLFFGEPTNMLMLGLIGAGAGLITTKNAMSTQTT